MSEADSMGMFCNEGAAVQCFSLWSCIEVSLRQRFCAEIPLVADIALVLFFTQHIFPTVTHTDTVDSHYNAPYGTDQKGAL